MTQAMSRKEALFRSFDSVRHRPVQNDTFEWIAIIVVPRLPLQRARRVGIACFPPHDECRAG